MRETNIASRLLGYVQLRIGERVVAVPVQAMKLERDGGRAPGGFYVEGSQLGIYVDGRGDAQEVAEQIRLASEEAAMHFARKYSN